MLDLDYPDILSLFPEHLDPKRNESASFLVWYLEKYYRLDPLEAVDAVCDQKGDKGVDGIYLNDNDMTLTIFQSRILQSSDRTIGDSALKEFAGTLNQFKDADSITNLIRDAGDAAVSQLAQRLDLVNKIGSYELHGEFVTNVELDHNGLAYLSGTNNITFTGKSQLTEHYISDERTPPKQTQVSFDIMGFHTTEYTADTNTMAFIAPIKAVELVNLPGIADQTLFALNVRGPLGRTQVNRDIINSIHDPTTHKQFPLFHNGITIISKEVEVSTAKITASDYLVVNGCQSLNAFYENRRYLSDDLRILTKFIKMDPGSPLSEKVTHYSITGPYTES